MTLSQRPFTPKPWTAGTTVSWPDGFDLISTGTVWSAGPEAASVWVKNDRTGEVLAVKLPTATGRPARVLCREGDWRRKAEVLAANYAAEMEGYRARHAA